MTSSSRPLCVTHHNCADGFGSRWVVWKYFKGDVDFHNGIYGSPSPDASGKDLIICDFSYAPEVMKKLVAECKSMTWLDHHKSAIEASEQWTRNLDATKLVAVLDMTRSGAMITWDYFFPKQEPPQLLKHIQDRDLWQFKLDKTEDVQAALFSYPYDLNVWDDFMTDTSEEYRDIYGIPSKVDVLAEEGAAISRKHRKDVAELVKVTQRTMTFGGLKVPVANLPYTLASDACQAMFYDNKTFSACYYDTPEGRCFSLRSPKDGVDVSVVAKQYGGGGHKHAAGFRVPLCWEGDE